MSLVLIRMINSNLSIPICTIACHTPLVHPWLRPRPWQQRRLQGATHRPLPAAWAQAAWQHSAQLRASGNKPDGVQRTAMKILFNPEIKSLKKWQTSSKHFKIFLIFLWSQSLNEEIPHFSNRPGHIGWVSKKTFAIAIWGKKTDEVVIWSLPL